jgi:hypothetical protein
VEIVGPRYREQGVGALVLASGPFYASGTFWAGAAVAVAVVAIVVPVVLWFLGSPRRLLVYGVVSETALLTSGARLQVGADLKVTLSGQVLNDPRVILLQVESRSRRDIRGTDFENAMPLMIDLGTPILNLLDLDTGGRGKPDVKVEVKNTEVAIGPGLIKRGQTISVNLLTDGPVSVTCAHPQLVDVIVKERRSDSRLGLVSAALADVPLPAALGVVLVGALVEVLASVRSRIFRS